MIGCYSPSHGLVRSTHKYEVRLLEAVSTIGCQLMSGVSESHNLEGYQTSHGHPRRSTVYDYGRAHLWCAVEPTPCMTTAAPEA